MATEMSDATSITEQAKRLHFAETLLHVSRTVSAMETLDEVLAALIDMTVRETDSDRGSLFLNDPATGELYSRVLQGEQTLEIRFLNDVGIAGRVFSTHEPLIINDAYADPRFNRDIDEQTGYTTRNVVCAPIKTARGVVIGVAQVLNKGSGDYSLDDLALIEAMTSQASAALVSASHLEDVDARRTEEMEFLRLRLGHHRGTRPGRAPAAGDGRGDPHAACRAVDAVPPRRAHRRALRPGGRG